MKMFSTCVTNDAILSVLNRSQKLDCIVLTYVTDDVMIAFAVVSESGGATYRLYYSIRVFPFVSFLMQINTF